MKIHEYQAKELLRRQGIAVPAGGVAFSPEEAGLRAGELGGYPLVVKAQIHAGGRGKGGGVRVVRSLPELRAETQALLGQRLITPQTPPEGKLVGKVLVEQGVEISQEFYLSLLPDRAAAKIAIVASGSGGMAIEEVAARHPERMIRLAVNPLLGFQPCHGRRIAYGLRLTAPLIPPFTALLAQLYDFFISHDCTLLEINPLVLTRAQEFVALDAKLEFDDSALFRQPMILALRDESEEDPREVEAGRYGLNYISLEGTVGSMVNGAGLAMATLDVIKEAGGEAANFLDVGGGANAEMVAHGLRIVSSDPRVKVIFINIFGGILRCDLLAAGVVQAARQQGLTLPLLVRLEGTNAERGRQILADSGLPLTTATTLNDAGEKISALLRRP